MGVSMPYGEFCDVGVIVLTSVFNNHEQITNTIYCQQYKCLMQTKDNNIEKARTSDLDSETKEICNVAVCSYSIKICVGLNYRIVVILSSYIMY